MKNLLACLALCASLSASAQVVYPYNPDANGDNAITSGDLLDFLPVFATTFTPQGITIDGVPLDEWLADLEAVVNSNAASIESLFAMQSQINALETANDNLQSHINSLQDQLNNLTFSVDGLPPCIDVDDDGICDFADACLPTALSFNYMPFSNIWAESDHIAPNGTYPNANLGQEDLSGACLIGIELFSANLFGAILTSANLSSANLTYAYLTDADLTGANLSGANLYVANLSGANLSGANLSGADLSVANLSDADLTGANLSGASLEEASLNYAIFEGASLSSANLSHANLSGVDLSGANLSGASMTCLYYGCPSQLPSGYICEPDPDCPEPDRYRIVPE